jgi:hypothetical protein
MTPDEQKIYDEFEAGGRALLAKAKADAAAIGADLAAIIGPTEKAVVKAVVNDWGTGWAWIRSAVKASWTWLLHWLDFLDDPRNGKFSHKRLLALAFGAVSIRQFLIGDWAGGVATGVACVTLAVVSALTKT